MRVFILIITAFAVIAAFLFFARKNRETHDIEPPIWEQPSFRDYLDKSGKLGVKGIAVLAPASGLRGDNVQKAYDMAEKLGVIFPSDSLKPEAIPYNANTDAQRLAELVRMLDAPDVEVIWALRGGYGASRLLDSLDGMRPPRTPKIFVGYSDMTFLHLFFEKWNWRTVHADMFWELSVSGDGKESENFFRLASLLAGEKKELYYDGLRPFNQAARELSGPLNSILTGGNLTCLASSVGTPWSVNAEGKILFIEDVAEKGYKIDRMLTQLQSAGILEKAEAVLMGEFTKGDEHLEFALARFADAFPKPVFRSEQFGHGKRNFPLIFGSPAVIEKKSESDSDFSLRLEAYPLP